MADKNMVSRVTGLASQALSHPVSRAARGKAFGAAKGVTGVAVTALRNRAGQSGSGSSSEPGNNPSEQPSSGGNDPAAASLSTAEPTGAPAEDTLDSAGSFHEELNDAPADTLTDTGSDDGAGDRTSASPSEEADLLPYPVLEEPVPIVEEALAAEEHNGPPVGGHATEPHASTRDEDHGDAQLQRAEQDEIADEVDEALPGGDLDLETPVGTTGADVGHNPDTAESDLQQPGTASGVDPGLASSVLKDAERGRSAAEGPDEVSS